MRVLLTVIITICVSHFLAAQTFNNVVNLDIAATDMEFIASKDRIYFTIRNGLNQQSGQLCILNPISTVVEQCIDLEYLPSKMVVSLDEEYLFVMHDSHNANFVSKIDVKTNTLIATIDLGRDLQFGDREVVDIAPSPFNSSHFLVSLKYSVPDQVGIALFTDDIELGVSYISNESSPILFADGVGPDNRLYIQNSYGYNSSAYGVIVNGDNIAIEQYENMLPSGSLTVIGNVIIDDFGEMWDISMNPPASIYDIIDIDFFYNFVPLSIGVDGAKLLALESQMLSFYSPELDYLISIFDIETLQKEAEFLVELDESYSYTKIIPLRNNEMIGLLSSSSITILSSCDENEIFDLELPILTGCLGQGLVISATPGYENYIWSNGMTGEQIEIFEEVQLSYSVIDENGCRSNESNVIFIEFVESTINPRIEASSSDLDFCKNDTLILEAVGNEFSLVFDHYLWSTGDTTESIFVTESGEYSVSAIGTNGCHNFSYDTLQVSFSQDTIPDRPNFTIVRDTTLPCSESIKELVGPEGYDIYAWSNGLSTQRIRVEEDDYYFLSVGSSIACLSDPSEWEYVEETSIVAQPTIQVNGNTLASSSALGNQWFLNGAPLIGETNQFYTPDQFGFYTVQVTIDGCESPLSDFVNFNLTSTSQNHEKLEVLVYPNPVDEFLAIEIISDIATFKSIKITSVIGQEIGSVDISNVQGDKIQISMSSLESGMYYLIFLDNQGEIRARKKVIKS